MGLTKYLGERYLWVDSLCIPQDDEKLIDTELKNMAYIFYNASLTIVAAQRTDSDYGLHGLQGISKSRSFTQQILAYDENIQLLCRQQPSQRTEKEAWANRGWTFQEALFSQRALVFENDTVTWICRRAYWSEETHELDQFQLRISDQSLYQELLYRVTPDPITLASLISTYAQKKFTYLGDMLRAFAGITTALSSSFNQGFICGLPVAFFHIALL